MNYIFSGKKSPGLTLLSMVIYITGFMAVQSIRDKMLLQIKIGRDDDPALCVSVSLLA